MAKIQRDFFLPSPQTFWEQLILRRDSNRLLSQSSRKWPFRVAQFWAKEAQASLLDCHICLFYFPAASVEYCVMGYTKCRRWYVRNQSRKARVLFWKSHSVSTLPHVLLLVTNLQNSFLCISFNSHNGFRKYEMSEFVSSWCKCMVESSGT